jgi:hypothetical protein
MNITALAQLVQTTPLLTQDERTYWLTHLSKLNKSQRDELAEALMATDAVLPFEHEISRYFDALGKAAEQALRKPASKTAA